MKEYIIELLMKDTGLSRMEVQASISELIKKGFAVERNGVLIPAINGVAANESI